MILFRARYQASINTIIFKKKLSLENIKKKNKGKYKKLQLRSQVMQKDKKNNELNNKFST